MLVKSSAANESFLWISNSEKNSKQEDVQQWKESTHTKREFVLQLAIFILNVFAVVLVSHFLSGL